MFKGFSMNAAADPSRKPPTPNDFFETISSSFAAALIAADQLSYFGCRFHRNGKDAVFVFRDPLHVGDELQRRYAAGVFPLVHPKILAEARGYLAEEAKKVREGGHARQS